MCLVPLSCSPQRCNKKRGAAFLVIGVGGGSDRHSCLCASSQAIRPKAIVLFRAARLETGSVCFSREMPAQRKRGAVAAGTCGGPPDDGSNAPKPTAAKRQKNPKKSLNCSMCGQCSSSTAWAAMVKKNGEEVPDGDACERCWLVWSAGFSYMKWEECCEKGSSNAFKKLFNQAHSVMTGDAKPSFHAQEVTADENVEYRMVRPYIALTRNEFRSKYGVFPEQLHMKVQDMRDERGIMTKMVILADPSSQRLCEFSSSSRVGWTTFIAHQSRVIHDGQGKETFDVTTESEREKLSKTFIDEDEVKDRLEKRQATVENAKVQAGGESGEESGEGTDDASEAEARTVISAGPTLMRTPQTDKKAGSAASRSRGGAGRSRGGRGILKMASLGMLRGGSPTSAQHNDGVSVDDFADIDIRAANISPALAEKLIRRTNLCSILCGGKVFRSAKTMPEWVQKFKEKGFEADAGRLELHFKRARCCQRVAKEVTTLSADELNDALSCLRDANVDFPSSTKLALLQRAVREAASGLRDEETLHHYLGVVTPWVAGAGDEVAFDPFKPVHGACDGSVADKANYFEESVASHILVASINEGESGKDKLLTFVRGLYSFLEEATDLDIDDGFGDVVMNLMQMCRGLMYMCFHLPNEFDSKFVDLQKLWDAASAGYAGGAPLKGVGTALQTCKFWSQRFRELKKISAKESAEFAKMVSLVGTLKAKPASGAWLACLNHLSTFRSNVRKSAADAFDEELAVSGAALVFDYTLRLNEQSDVDSVELDNVQQALSLWGNFFPMTSEMQVLNQIIQKRQNDVDFSSRAQAVQAAAKNLFQPGRGFSTPPDIVTNLRVAVSAARGLDAADYEALRDPAIDSALVSLQQATLSYVEKENCQTQELGVMVEVGQGLCAWAGSPKVAQESQATFKLVSSMHDLRLSLRKWVALGPLGDGDRMEAQERQQVFIELGSAVAIVREFAGLAPRAGPASQFVDEAMAAMSATKAIVLQTCERDLLAAQSALEPLRLGGEEGRPWYAEVDDISSFEELAEHAETTLLSADGEALSTSVQLLDRLAAHFAHVSRLFSQEPGAVYDAAIRMLREARATEVEACILLAVQSTTNLLKLKRMVKQARSEAQEAGHWDFVLEAIRAKAALIAPVAKPATRVT